MWKEILRRRAGPSPQDNGNATAGGTKTLNPSGAEPPGPVTGVSTPSSAPAVEPAGVTPTT